ncbi:MAG TPA: AI-2E family transporter [Burkholderiales bacterium]|nr:AI-2E family transporter [Burkholderiales bacterium]
MSDQQFYARSFALVALAILGYLLYRILEPFFAPMAWAFFIAFLLQPVQQRLARRLRGRASLSSALLSLATLVVLVGPLTGLLTAFAAQAADLLRWAQDFAAENRPANPSDLASLPVVGPALAWFQEASGVSLAQIQGWAIEGARAALKFAAGLGKLALLGALGTVIGFILMMFILFFAIRDGRALFETLRSLVPLSPQERTRLFAHLAAVTRATVFGTGVTAVVQGLLVGIGFALVGLPSPVVFGVLAALCALIPLAGTPVVWVPAVVALALQDRWGAAAFLLGWGAMVATLDNFLRPMLVSGRAEIGTLTVFLGVLGGVGVFGAIGVVLGPLVLALIVALVRFILETGSAEA